MFDPKTASAAEVAKFVKEDTALARAIAEAKPPEIPRHMDGTPVRLDDRVDWKRADVDQTYFEEIYRSGAWEAGRRAIAERERAEQEAAQRIEGQKAIARMLADMDAKRIDEQRAEDDRERVRSQGIFPPAEKK